VASAPASLIRVLGALERRKTGEITGRYRLDLAQAEAGSWKPSRFLSRRFVVGSLVALGILVANAFVSYRTVANLIEASRTVENTLKVVGTLKDVQDAVADSQIELRGYILSGERDRLIQAQAYLGRAANLV
jgi:hypothetical protein